MSYISLSLISLSFLRLAISLLLLQRIFELFKCHYCHPGIISVSLLLGRRTNGNLTWCFHPSLQVLERGFLQKPIISTGRKGRLELCKLQNLLGHIMSKLCVPLASKAIMISFKVSQLYIISLKRNNVKISNKTIMIVLITKGTQGK